MVDKTEVFRFRSYIFKVNPTICTCRFSMFGEVGRASLIAKLIWMPRTHCSNWYKWPTNAQNTIGLSTQFQIAIQADAGASPVIGMIQQIIEDSKALEAEAVAGDVPLHRNLCPSLVIRASNLAAASVVITLLVNQYLRIYDACAWAANNWARLICANMGKSTTTGNLEFRLLVVWLGKSRQV